MVTLLEFVCEQLLGEPTYRNGNGEATWPCPRCDHPRFHTLPHLEGEKDRFRCFRCDWWGDVFDMLQEHFPDEFFPDRQARLNRLAKQWQRGVKVEEPSEPEPQPDHDPDSTIDPILFLPRTSVDFRQVSEQNHAASDAWAELTPAERDTLINAQSIIRAKANGVPFELLASHCREFAEWAASTDAEHLDGCDDPDCDTVVCRAARGLQPLTAKQIRAKTAEQERQRQAYRARIMAQILNGNGYGTRSR